MPTRTAHPHGTPCWIDLGSPDVAASIAFYGGLFGWEAEPAGPAPERGAYGFFTLRGERVGGYLPLEGDDRVPAWSTYVAVDDADAAAARAAASGGATVVAPQDIARQGRMAVVTDPGGALIGICERADAHLVAEPGARVWSELMTRDAERVEGFYRELFGWVDEAGMLDLEEYAVWKLGDEAVGGMLPMGDAFPADVPAHWMTYFAVDDCDATAARAQDLGGAVCAGPADESVGRFATLADPHGALFSVIALADR